jgi:hypothetical protein
MAKDPEEQEDFQVVNVYVGEETTVWYDEYGDQHVEMNDV